MPAYTKRIVGPSTSFPPMRFAVASQALQNKLDDKRLDGRQPQDLRPFYLKVGVVSQAKGSAYIEMGKTKVLCSVYGPREMPKKLGFTIKGQILCEFKYAPFSCTIRRQHQQDQEEKEISQVLKQALEPVICLHTFPKARVEVYILVLDNDGGVISGSITAAGAALADAGIPMFDLITGCDLVCKGETLLIDPTSKEQSDTDAKESTSHGTMVLGLMPSLQQVTCLLQDGIIGKHTAIQGLNKLNDCCHQIRLVVEQGLMKSWKHESKERSQELRS